MGAATGSCSKAERATRGVSIQGHPGNDEGPDAGTSAASSSTAKYWHDKMRLSAASQAIFDGAQCGDARKVLNALNAHGDPNCVNFAGYTALMLAVGGGYREVVALLLQASGNPNYALGGLSPLMIAAAAGQIEVARMLVNCGASSTSTCQKSGWAALHRACKHGHADLAGLLLQAGASVDTCDWQGSTPLMIAVEAGHLDTTRTLLCAGASIGLTDHSGANALTKAVTCNRAACLDLLLKAGAPLNVGIKTTGDTALCLATRVGDEPICRRLLQFKANVNLANQHRETPLMLAADGGHTQVVHVLLLAGADTTYGDLEGHTFLMHAAMAGHAQVCVLGLDFGANPSQVSAVDHETPVTLAARNGFMEAYKVLITAGGAVRSVEDTEAAPGFSLRPDKR